MKFQSLKIDRFGSLADFELEFDTGAPMQILFGPNEAGKSTFLALIRELLFGFPHHGSDYHYSGTGRQIAAEARLVMADPESTTLHFRREKGVNNKQVQGEASPSGEKIDDASLLRRLGGVSKSFYENVFGFSLGELASGEKSLEEANLDEALYGTGLGGLKGLQSVQSELAAESNKLWLSRGKKQKINHLLGKVKGSTDSLRDAILRPDEYEARLERHRQAEAALEKIRSENEASRRTLKHLERLRDSLEPYRELAATRRKLDKLKGEWGDSLARFPREGRQTMDDLCREIKNAEARLEEIDRQITDATGRIDALECCPTLLEQEPTIRQLFQTLKQIRDYRDAIPKSEQELESIRRQVLATINELDPSWTIESLDRYHISLDRRTQIEEMADEFSKLQEQRALNEERRADRRKDLDASLARLESIASTVESAELLAIVERQADYMADQRKHQELQEQLEGFHWKKEEAERKLFCVSGLDHEGLGQLTVPLEETVREFDDQLEEAEQAVRISADQFQQAEEKLRQLKIRRDEIEATGSAPTREKLEEARTLRDEGWQLLRRRYVESKKIPAKHFKDWMKAVNAEHPSAASDASSTTPKNAASDATAKTEADTYELTVQRVDQLFEERQAKADLVAKLDSLAQQTVVAEGRRDEYRTQLEAVETTRREMLTKWRTVWEPCDITPLLPKEMLRWLENYDAYLGLLREVKTIETQDDSIEHRLEKFQQQLRQVCVEADLLPKDLFVKEEETSSADTLSADTLSANMPSTDTLFVTAKQHVDQCRESQAKRQEIQSRLPELKSELKQLDKTGEELAGRADDWTKRWARFLEELSLPTDWTPKMADVTLSRLYDARREYQKIDPMEKRLDEIRAEVKQFDRQTCDLCRKIAEDLAELPPEQAVETLHARLEEAKGAVIEKRTAVENREVAERQRAAFESQRIKLRAERGALLETTGVEADMMKVDATEAGATETDQAFYEAADRAETQRTLLAEIQNQTDQIDRFITGEEQPDIFWKELEATDADTFELKLNQAKGEDARISDERDAAASEQGLAARALKELDQTDLAVLASAKLESHRSELHEATDRWATLSVAQSLIDDAIRRFERENQPEMLQDIQRLFAVMTAERYTQVRRRMNEQSTLVVIEQGGTEKVPAQLSTGTREQLYLAMRLAYVIHYCRRNEPLPLVMDDVLVNFDATRAAGTVDALAEVARSTQIIFLTCHKHTVDLIEARLPDAPVCRIGYN